MKGKIFNAQEVQAIDQELNGFIESLKEKKSGPIFDKNGRLIGFVDFEKPDGHNKGFDCPTNETDKEKLKKISKPKLIET